MECPEGMESDCLVHGAVEVTCARLECNGLGMPDCSLLQAPHVFPTLVPGYPMGFLSGINCGIAICRFAGCSTV